MSGLADTIRAAGARAAEEHQKTVRDRLIAYYADAYGHAAAYDSVIIVAGYAAFFALWSAVTEDISTAARLVTVALMGGSLLFYIAWHIIQMLTRQKSEWRRAAAFRFHDDPTRFNAEWIAIDQAQSKNELRVMRLWPWIFIPAVALGFAGGGLLAYHALAAVLGWPQL